MHSRFLSSLLLPLLLATTTVSSEVAVYKVDPVHSGISFKIRHFINKVPGVFNDFSGEIHFDKTNPANSKATATIQVGSVDTRNNDRDAHLQNEDFFESNRFPTIKFTSTKWEKTGEDTFQVSGDLQILGRTNPVVLDVTYLGEVEGRGQLRSGWEAKGSLDRSDWGMGYGTPVVGKTVDIELNIQAHRQEKKKQ